MRHSIKRSALVPPLYISSADLLPKQQIGAQNARSQFESIQKKNTNFTTRTSQESIQHDHDRITKKNLGFTTNVNKPVFPSKSARTRFPATNFPLLHFRCTTRAGKRNDFRMQPKGTFLFLRTIWCSFSASPPFTVFCSFFLPMAISENDKTGMLSFCFVLTSAEFAFLMNVRFFDEGSNNGIHMHGKTSSVASEGDDTS